MLTLWMKPTALLLASCILLITTPFIMMHYTILNIILLALPLLKNFALGSNISCVSSSLLLEPLFIKLS
jgi:hypothetical protein